MNHLHYQALLNKSPIDFYTLKYVICCFKMYLVLSYWWYLNEMS